MLTMTVSARAEQITCQEHAAQTAELILETHFYMILALQLDEQNTFHCLTTKRTITGGGEQKVQGIIQDVPWHP